MSKTCKWPIPIFSQVRKPPITGRRWQPCRPKRGARIPDIVSPCLGFPPSVGNINQQPLDVYLYYARLERERETAEVGEGTSAYGGLFKRLLKRGGEKPDAVPASHSPEPTHHSDEKDEKKSSDGGHVVETTVVSADDRKNGELLRFSVCLCHSLGPVLIVQNRISSLSCSSNCFVASVLVSLTCQSLEGTILQRRRNANLGPLAQLPHHHRYSRTVQRSRCAGIPRLRWRNLGLHCLLLPGRCRRSSTLETLLPPGLRAFPSQELL